MRRVLCLSLLLIVFAAVAMSQQNPNPPSSSGNTSSSAMQSNAGNTSSGNSANENTLFQNEKSLWEAWKTHNAQPFQQNISQNAVDVSGTGVKTGQQNVVQDLTSGNCQVNNYSLSDQKFTWYDQNTALLTYRADQDATCNGNKLPSSVYASTLWVNKAGKWEAAFHQETPAQQQSQQQQQPH
jgi:hypothetical protein